MLTSASDPLIAHGLPNIVEAKLQTSAGAWYKA
jgi:hypothetical protein